MLLCFVSRNFWNIYWHSWNHYLESHPLFPSHAQSSSGASVPLPWWHCSTIQCLAARRSVLHYRDGHLLDRPAVLLDCLFKCSVSNRLSLCYSDGASLARQSRRSVIASSREVKRNGYVFFLDETAAPLQCPFTALNLVGWQSPRCVLLAWNALHSSKLPEASRWKDILMLSLRSTYLTKIHVSEP